MPRKTGVRVPRALIGLFSLANFDGPPHPVLKASHAKNETDHSVVRLWNDCYISNTTRNFGPLSALLVPPVTERDPVGRP